MSPTRDLETLLERMLGDGATFRPGQREAIDAILDDGARVLVVQKTGWGKSIVYWLATRVRRDEGHGPTLIISPLLALMRNQIEMARRIGLRAMTINSGNTDAWDEVRDALERDRVDVLLVSPERLGNDQFLREFLPSIQGSIGLFVVDEVHCISDWGHDFRPDYRRIGAILRALPASLPVLGTTATANQRVIDDVAAQLGPATRRITGPLRRDSLRLGAFTLRDQAERLAWLAAHIPRMPGAGIVYCLTVADTFRVADWLRSRGIDAHAYNASLEPDARVALEDGLLANRFRVLVATVALGMGFDKPDLGFVIHYQRPGSVIAYYQQVGRAGRALDDAWGIVLSGQEDDEIQEYFITTAFPPLAQMESVVGALETMDTASIPQLEARLNIGRGRLAAILKVLDVDGAVIRVGGRFQRTLQPWAPDAERIEEVTARRREELAQMQAYMTHPGCLMQFLAHALDDPDAQPCGRCATEDPEFIDATVDRELARDAVHWLRRRPLEIEPRKAWPAGAVDGLSGKISPTNETGVALSLQGDAGWGRDVARGMREGRFSDELLDAAAELIRARWSPSAAGRWWVIAIPSTRSGSLVGDAARGIASRLGLPFRDDVLMLKAATAEQRTMANSVQQLRNVHPALAIHAEPDGGPVIVVDDIVDSRWTLTLAGHLLRKAGSGAVHPFALAQATAGTDD